MNLQRSNRLVGRVQPRSVPELEADRNLAAEAAFDDRPHRRGDRAIGLDFASGCRDVFCQRGLGWRNHLITPLFRFRQD